MAKSIKHWYSPWDMPDELYCQAKASGMWNDDVDNVWFFKKRERIPKEITKYINVGRAIVFPVEGGKVIVEYHS